MRLSLLCAVAAIAMSAAATQKAEAAGCIKGAVVGGVAGHYAGHHGVMGAVGGCIVGHHMAKVAAQNRAEQEQTEHLNSQQLQNTQQRYR